MVLEIIVAIGITINVIAVAWALRRFVAMSLSNSDVSGRVTAILPLTGQAPNLEELVARLEGQSVALSELLIAVESTDDPAYRRASDVVSSTTLPIRIVVAGLADDEGQKCRNQQAALAQIANSADLVVLLDADIRPASNWLLMLLSPLMEPTYNLVTGHRWHQVSVHGLGAHLATAVDRGVTLLPRLDIGLAQVAWGGSLALSRETAAAMDLPGCLRGELSDDLSIGLRATVRGLKIATRSALLIASPVDLPLVAAWRFGRRQYQICKIYMPELWTIALVILGGRLAGWGGAISLAFGHPAVWWPVALLAALGLVKQILVAAVGARAGLPDNGSVQAVQYVLGVLQPAVDLFHISLVIAAGWTRTVSWGHVTYEISGPGRIRVIERLPYSS